MSAKESQQSRRTLGDLRPRESARVVSVRPGSAGRLRLLELGLTPGTEVSVVRVAPMGDPIEVRVRGYHLAVSREDGCCVFCE
ncbi:hypothetical protein ABI59_19030 [Acidobacteria bacterium Mor1]|nr:hypothetical protein ABI59_19030 [Acidobacteria bacterium Mor1]